MTTFTFRTQAHWTTQRRGIVEAESIPRTIDFSAPKEFGGGPCLWTPEHFLLAAVSTCFVSTLRAIAEASKLPFSDLQVSTEGTVEKLQGGYRFTQILLRPTVTIEREDDRERMARIMEKAERRGLVSRSLACKMLFEPGILVGTVSVV